jgi:hypothetical protein
MPEYLESMPTVGTTNINTALLLAELHIQNELLYALLNKDAKNNPVPDKESIRSLYRFYRSALDDPASTDTKYPLPLRDYIRPDNTSDDMTLLEDIQADGHY